MDDAFFPEFLSMILADAVRILCEEKGISENQALYDFMHSRVYEKLEDESTKVWHLSPGQLCLLYDIEKSGQPLRFPEL